MGRPGYPEIPDNHSLIGIAVLEKKNRPGSRTVSEIPGCGDRRATPFTIAPSTSILIQRYEFFYRIRIMVIAKNATTTLKAQGPAYHWPPSSTNALTIVSLWLMNISVMR